MCTDDPSESKAWYTAAVLQTLYKELTINIYEMMQSTERHEEVSLQLC